MHVEDIASQSSVVFETGYTLQHDWKDKRVISAFVISQQIKEVTANGHEKLIGLW